MKINIISKKGYDKFYEEEIYLLKYNEIRNLILKYKFNYQNYLYHTFATLILKNKKLCRKLKFYDIIIPVPMYPKKKMQRGYNQTELIMREVSKLLGIQMNIENLIKIKDTKKQSTLKGKERHQNIEGAFKIVNK